VDWGLAKAVGAVAGQPGLDAEPAFQPSMAPTVAETALGAALGTPAYMSPEQAAGCLDQLGPTSDVYSLGATLYCLLTGQAPFDSGDVPHVLAAVQSGEFSAPEDIKAGVPTALAAVCRKAMALAPRARYASARALADDIEHWLADEPVAAYPEPVHQRAGRWVRRHKPTVAALAALAGVLLAAGVAWWQVAQTGRRADEQGSLVATMAKLRDDANQQREQAIRQREEAQQQRRRAEDAEKLTQRYRYDDEMQLAQQAWQAGDVKRLRDRLDGLRPERTGGEDLRGIEWHYLWHLARRELFTIKAGNGPVFSVSFSPDGRFMAGGCADGTVKVLDAWTGRTFLTVKAH